MRDETIIQYIQQQVDEDTRKSVEAWIMQSSENEAYYHSLRDTWVAALYASESTAFDAHSAWDVFNKRIKAKSRRRRVMSSVRWISSSIAAAVVILFGVFTLLESNVEVKTHTYSDSDNITLPDGSSVYLNKEAVINYPEDFLAATREITIFGEAFFEVAPDEDKPFIVKAGDFRVKVLGTRFNVREVRSDVHEVYVKEGKVAVYAAGSQNDATILLPGDLLVLKSGHKPEMKVAGRNYMSWKTNELIFENTSLNKVVKQIGAYYNADIRTTESIADYRLTARFKEKSLDETLQVIKMIFDVKVQEKEGHIFLSANSPPKDETKEK